jgi:U3 small nucleolar ribonucleoprotein protein IMP4
VEDKERSILERKRKLRDAVEEGRVIPTELRADALELKKAMKYDDVEREDLAATTHMDDEYVWAGVEDPKIVITTSHNPSSRLKQFAKELRLMFPNAQRLNRGNYVMSQLVQACIANDITDLIIIHEHRGDPDGLVVCHLPYGPTASFSLSNTVMRHDLPDVGTMSEAYPHLIFHNFKTNLGLRVQSILKYLFPVPKADSKRVVTFANSEDYISFRHHVYKKSGLKDIDLKEVGPRFEMRLYEIKLGTVDQAEVDVEWRLRPYMNTARKRYNLSTD